MLAQLMLTIAMVSDWYVRSMRSLGRLNVVVHANVQLKFEANMTH